jgi:hypothetical protein
MGVGLTSKTYFGKFVKGRKQVVVRSDITTSPLRCRDFFTPSFAWGYHGGAPDNLAIAISARSLRIDWRCGRRARPLTVLCVR